MRKILLKNGIIVSGKKCYASDVLIEGEKIKKIGRSIKVAGSQCSPLRDSGSQSSPIQVIDCKGKYIFPGFIDGHTHFDLSVAGTTTIDDFESGTKAAISGGTTTIIPKRIKGFVKGSSPKWQNAGGSIPRSSAGRSTTN